MTDSKGWISIYRQLTEKWYYTDSEYVHLWLHLLLKASFKQRTYIKWGKKITEDRGEICTSLLDLQKETGIDDCKIRRILNHFIAEEQIEEHKIGRKYSHIKIINYDTFQSEQQNEDKISEKKVTDEEEKSEQTKNNSEKEDNANKFLNNGALPNLREGTGFKKLSYNFDPPQADNRIKTPHQEQAFRYAKNLGINLHSAEGQIHGITGRWVHVFKRGQQGKIDQAYSFLCDLPKFQEISDVAKIMWFFSQYANPGNSKQPIFT